MKNELNSKVRHKSVWGAGGWWSGGVVEGGYICDDLGPSAAALFLAKCANIFATFGPKLHRKWVWHMAATVSGWGRNREPGNGRDAWPPNPPTPGHRMRLLWFLICFCWSFLLREGGMRRARGRTQEAWGMRHAGRISKSDASFIEPAACRCKNMLYVGADTGGVAVVRGGKFNSIVNSIPAARIRGSTPAPLSAVASPALLLCGHKHRRQFRGLGVFSGGISGLEFCWTTPPWPYPPWCPPGTRQTARPTLHSHVI